MTASRLHLNCISAASRQVNSDSVKELRDLFQKIDTDDSGQIDFEEFKKMLREHTELHVRL